VNRSCKVLLADDDPEIREVVAIVLEPYGFETLVAADGEEAIRLVKLNPDIDVIVADLMMPRVSGGELLKALTADPSLRHIPVIVLSGDNSAKETARSLGATACLQKPVDLSELVARLRQLAVR
jgi:CheY-like chemotaxis protein